MPNHQQQPNTQQPQGAQGPKTQPQGTFSEPTASSPTTGPKTMTSPSFSQAQEAQGQPSKPALEPGALADKAVKAVDQVKTNTLERVESVRERAHSGIAERRNMVVERIGRVGHILHDASESLRTDDELLARWVDEAGLRIDRVADYVSHADIGDMIEDVREFARARPAWFVGGAFLAGLAIGRFFKSGSGSSESAGGFGASLEPGYRETDESVRVRPTEFVGGPRYPASSEPSTAPDVPKVEP